MKRSKISAAKTGVCLLLFILCKPHITFAQDQSEIFRNALRVKLLDEFIARFNCDSTPQNSILPYLDTILIKDAVSLRRWSVKSLFRRDPKLDSLKINSLLDTITSQKAGSSTIHLSDTNWHADVLCEFLLDGSIKQLHLIMRTYTDSLGGMEWYIANVDGVVFDGLNSKFKESSIAPIAHELDFLTLQKVFEDSNNIMTYFRKEFSVDKLSVFVYLLKSNRLKFKRVVTNVFIFNQIPGWTFYVKDFKEDSYNSGLLIYKLESDE